ncbi:hypothetical protein PI126_g5766 [Phytophthora idaei]|nr:hypothetical protein PI126_g5766 [Phytophthora idaei]
MNTAGGSGDAPMDAPLIQETGALVSVGKTNHSFL